MTDLDDLLARITTVLNENDATRLPPIVKLTREQLDSIPTAPRWNFGGPIRGWTLGDLTGVPVQLVDHEHQSTPHLLRHGGALHAVRDNRVVEPALVAVPSRRPSWWRRILGRTP